MKTSLRLCAWAGLLTALALGAPAQAAEVSPAKQAMIDSMKVNSAAFKDYMHRCAGCHRFDGEGVPQHAVPSFVNSIALFTHLPEGREYMIRVPGASQALLENAELADVLNWMVANYSPPEQIPDDFRPFTANEVGAVRPYRFDDVTLERARMEQAMHKIGLEPAPYTYGVN